MRARIMISTLAVMWRRLAPAARVLLALALAGPWPATALAQTVTYVGNVDQQAASFQRLIGSQAQAQPFRTGSQSGGYPLRDVVLRLQDIRTGTLTVTIRENTAQNFPSDSILYRLTNPASLASGLNTFTAPSGATLQPDTRYHVVAQSSGGTAASWFRSLRINVDDGGADGWDITFSYLTERLGGGWRVDDVNFAFMARVRGETRSPPPLPGETLLSNIEKAESARGSSASETRRFSQSFQTGSVTGGYRLHGIALHFNNDITVDSGALAVALWSDDGSGLPGSRLHTLTNPSPVTGTGVNEFTAPAGVILAADTDYHVVMEYSSNVALRWSLAGTGLDSGAAAGWELPGRRYRQLRTAGAPWPSGWTTLRDGNVAIAVKGTAIAPSLPTVAVAPVASPVAEGEDAQFRVTRTGVTAGALTVNYRVSETGDMVASGEEGAQSVDFGDGDTEQTVTVPTVEDSVHEADSAVTLALTADAAYELGTDATAEVTVEDDDNAAPTGAPTIDDTTPVVGETLTAEASGIADADGLAGATYAWQWIRVAAGGTETPITGATTASYTVVAADLGATLKVEVSFTDDDGTAETVASAATATVEAPPKVTLTLTPDSISENGGVSTLKALLDRASSQDTVVTVSVAPVAPATANDYSLSPVVELLELTLPAGETESTETVTITAVDNNVSAPDKEVTVSATASNAQGVTAPDNVTLTLTDDDDSPTTGTVTVTGTPTEGETLTADTSGLTDADGLDNAGYAYQWVRTPSGGSDADISGATSRTYTPVFLDAGATLKVRVTVTDDEGHEATFTSAPTVAVAALPRPEVTVASDGDVMEGSPALFTLMRTGATAETLDVAYEVTASGNFGVMTGAGTATFLANAATVQVSLATTDDTTAEADGSVTLTLQANPVAYELGADAAATAAIRDDDEETPPMPMGNVLISNIETSAGSFFSDPASSDQSLSQPFLTGSVTGGYALHGISLRFNGTPEIGSGLRVTLRESAVDGSPASNVLHTLTNPSPVMRVGVNEFRAPAGVVLAAGTRYHVVLEYSSDSGTPRWSRASPGVDSGAAEGWELPFASYFQTGGTPWAQRSYSFVAAVRGTEIASEPLPTVTLALTPDTLSEASGESSTVTASLDRLSSAETTVTVTVTPVSPAVAGDYTLSTNRELTIPTGAMDSVGLVTITPVNDQVDQPNKRVTVSATATNAQGGHATAGRDADDHGR